MLSKAPDSLKVISRYGAGVDRVDMPAATAKGIKVTNTPGTNSVAVCELAFALMLCAARNIPSCMLRLRKANGREARELSFAEDAWHCRHGCDWKESRNTRKSVRMTVNAYDPYFDEAFAKEKRNRQDGP